MNDMLFDAIPVIHLDGITPREGVFTVKCLQYFALAVGILIKQIDPVNVLARVMAFYLFQELGDGQHIDSSGYSFLNHQ